MQSHWAAFGNQFGIFVRHARHVLVTGNVVSGNCQGILVPGAVLGDCWTLQVMHHRDDHRPGSGSRVWTLHAVRPG